MSFSRCVTRTKGIQHLLVRRYSQGHAGRLRGNITQGPRHERCILTYATPHFSIQLRLHSTDHPSLGTDLPPPLQKDFKSVNLTDIPAVNDLKEVHNEKLDSQTQPQNEVKPSSEVEPQVEAQKEVVSAAPQPSSDSDKTPKKEVKKSAVVVSNVPRPALHKRVWLGIKGTAIHYWDGFKLLTIEVKILSRSTRKITQGQKLTRREKQQATRTFVDLFRLVPFFFFVAIPFMEIFLPVALWLFPNMLPSTFETIDKKKEKKLKALKLKLDMAKFLQQSLDESNIGLQKAKPLELARFIEFVAKTKAKTVSDDPNEDIEELISFSKLFSNHMTLDNLRSSDLVALCKLLNVSSIGTDTFMRFMLRHRLESLHRDDTVIQSEGLHTLSPLELQKANSDRGMRSVGVSKERLTLQMEQWLELHLNQELPATLLLLSRALYLPSGPVPSYEDLKSAVAHLPDNLIGEAKLKIAAQKGEKIENRARLDAVRSTELLIAKDKEQQDKKDAKQAAAQAAKAEQELKQESNTRVGAHLLMYKNESIKDLAKPILTEDEIQIQKEELLEISSLISSLRDRKNPLTEEKEELKDLLDMILEHEAQAINQSEEGVKRSRRNKMLSDKVVTMLTKSNKVLNDLERTLEKEEVLDIHTKDDELVLTRQDIKSAVKHLQTRDKKDKLLEILGALSDSSDGSIKTSAILQILEKITNEDTDLSKTEIRAILKIAQMEKSSTAPPKKE